MYKDASLRFILVNLFKLSYFKNIFKQNEILTKKCMQNLKLIFIAFKLKRSKAILTACIFGISFLFVRSLNDIYYTNSIFCLLLPFNNKMMHIK